MCFHCISDKCFCDKNCVSHCLQLTHLPFSIPEEEEEEEEESDDEGQELSLPSDGPVLGEESLEPPAKLARTDQRVLFTTGSAEN